jgi:hypothetical protein
MTQCPQCGYQEPAQNSFKPNVMSEYYIPKTKETVVANDNEEELEHPTKGVMIRLDVHKARLANEPTPVTKTPPPPATIKPTPAPQAKPTLIPAKPIPASAIKTKEEIAATPKSATVATPVVETPLVANIIPTSEGQP